MKKLIVVLSICFIGFLGCVQKPTYNFIEISNATVTELDEKTAKELGLPFPSIIIKDSYGQMCILTNAKLTNKKLTVFVKLAVLPAYLKRK